MPPHWLIVAAIALVWLYPAYRSHLLAVVRRAASDAAVVVLRSFAEPY